MTGTVTAAEIARDRLEGTVAEHARVGHVVQVGHGVARRGDGREPGRLDGPGRRHVPGVGEHEELRTTVQRAEVRGVAGKVGHDGHPVIVTPRS